MILTRCSSTVEKQAKGGGIRYSSKQETFGTIRDKYLEKMAFLSERLFGIIKTCVVLSKWPFYSLEEIGPFNK